MTLLRSARVAAFLAARSLTRGNAGVTAMSISMLAAVFLSVSFLPALIGGASTALEAQVRDTLTGDLTIRSEQQVAIDDADAYAAELASDPDVAAATPLRRVGTQVGFGRNSNAWAVDAIDPQSFGAVFSTPTNLIEGEFLEPGDEEGIVLGIDIAGAGRTELRGYGNSLRSVHAGDTVEVTMVDGQVQQFVVRGIFRNQFPLSDATAYITISAADELVSEESVADQVRSVYEALDDVAEVLDKAANSSKDLAHGAEQLASAAGSLAGAAHDVAAGAEDVAAAAAQLADAAASVDQAAEDLASTAARLADNLATISEQMDGPVLAAARTSTQQAEAVAREAAELASSCPGSGADPAFCAAVADHAAAAGAAAAAAAQSQAAVQQAADAVRKAASAADQLADGLAGLAGGTQSLVSGAEELQSGASSVASGASGVATGASAIAEQAAALADGANELAKGLRKGAKSMPDEKEREQVLDTLDSADAPPGRDTATRIVVQLVEGANPAATQHRLETIRNDVEFQSPEELSGMIQDQLQTFDLINTIMSVISLVVAAITVFIITYVDLSNRRRQIGIERAIGIRSSAIVGSYVLKSLATAVVGIAIGWLLFQFAVAPLVDRYPFQFPNGPVSLEVSVEQLLSTTGVLLIVAAVSALVPAVQSVRMRILDAIWGA